MTAQIAIQISTDETSIREYLSEVGLGFKLATLEKGTHTGGGSGKPLTFHVGECVVAVYVRPFVYTDARKQYNFTRWAFVAAHEKNEDLFKQAGLAIERAIASNSTPDANSQLSVLGVSWNQTDAPRLDQMVTGPSTEERIRKVAQEQANRATAVRP